MFEQLAISRQQLAKSELSTLSVILSGAFAAVANAESKDLTPPANRRSLGFARDDKHQVLWPVPAGLLKTSP
jgi:hypothetical protein